MLFLDNEGNLNAARDFEHNQKKLMTKCRLLMAIVNRQLINKHVKYS